MFQIGIGVIMMICKNYFINNVILAPKVCSKGQGIGYAEAMAVLDGRMTREEAATRIALRTRHLAKRQRTWFRHQLEVDWVAGPEDARDVPRAADQVLEVWKRHGKTPVSV